MWHLRFSGGIWHGENMHMYVCIGQESEVKSSSYCREGWSWNQCCHPTPHPPPLSEVSWRSEHHLTGSPSEDSPLFFRDRTSSAVRGMFGTGYLRALCIGIVNVTAGILTTHTLFDLSSVHEWIWSETWKITATFATWLPESRQMFGLHETVPTEVPQSCWCVCVHSGQDYRLNIWKRKAVQTEEDYLSILQQSVLQRNHWIQTRSVCSFTHCWWSWQTWQPTSWAALCSASTSICCCQRLWCSPQHWASGSPSTASLPREVTSCIGELASCLALSSLYSPVLGLFWRVWHLVAIWWISMVEVSKKKKQENTRK